MSASGLSRPSATTSSLPYTLAVIALTVAIIGMGAALGISTWLDWRAERSAAAALEATYIKTIGAQHYVVPAALLPQPGQHREGFAERMDLAFTLPLGPAGALTEIGMTIVPRGRIVPSATLLDSVYMRQFGTGQASGVPGLVGKPLDGDAGTSGETVWYDPLSAQPFAAKCMQPISTETPGLTCLRALPLSDRNTAVIRFAPHALANWRAFDRTVEQWLDGLRR
ncbi:hypothetical protein [Pelagibacterium montanilacus]|uniref:hypothetical protein n=1 Tax=Pelagibacterium montanilacus TaxID=2185280 RepID=UPI000F8E63C3|nr:hypothetical protein [Pelagibacterium montanilacus]